MNSERLDRAIKKWTEVSEGHAALTRKLLRDQAANPLISPGRIGEYKGDS